MLYAHFHNVLPTCSGYRKFVMPSAHFLDVADDKMKSDLVRNTAGTHLDHSLISLSLKTPI